MMNVFCFLILSFLFSCCECNYFVNLERQMIEMEQKLSSSQLNDDFSYGRDNPKSISIHCPGPESPVVSIADMDIGNIVGENSECLNIKITGKNFELDFSANCD